MDKNFKFGLPDSVIDAAINVLMEARKPTPFTCPTCKHHPCQCKKALAEETCPTCDSGVCQCEPVTEAKKMKGVCPHCGKNPCECDHNHDKMDEELKGNQKKIDANHNGKIDAEDFKLLKQKKMKEEVEFSAEEMARIEEIAANLDEVVRARKMTPAEKKAREEYLKKSDEKLAHAEKHAVTKGSKSFKDYNMEPGDHTKEPSKMGLRQALADKGKVS
jgi:formylmethanofuran dehydrogenase subunit B